MDKPITPEQLLELGFETGKVISASLEPSEIYDQRVGESHLVITIPYNRETVTVKCLIGKLPPQKRMMMNNYMYVIDTLAKFNHPLAVAIMRDSKITNLFT